MSRVQFAKPFASSKIKVNKTLLGSVDDLAQEEDRLRQKWNRQIFGLFSPFIRNCTQESGVITCQITGHIPRWVSGYLLRNGPGLNQIGDDRYGHMFDGIALLQQFKIERSKVFYQNKFLKSDSYKKNTAANRIVVTEFGTRAHADPCTNILKKFTNYFSMASIFSDNDLVGFCKIADDVYAVADTPLMRKINPDTLDTSGPKLNMRHIVAVNTSTSHPHTDTNGDVYNMGSNVGTYNIVKFDRKHGLKMPLVVASIPTGRPLSPGYFHSFGMTSNYFVFIEQPLVISIPTVLWQQYSLGVNSKILKWRPEYKTRFFLVDRKTSKVVKQKYFSSAFAFFHTINAYEDQNSLVIDICTYPDGDIFNAMLVDTIDKASKSAVNTKRQANMLRSRAERFVLPLVSSRKHSKKEIKEYCYNGAVAATTQKDGSILCISEPLTQIGCSVAEMPQINYQMFNGRKYRFFYAITRRDSDYLLGLMKCNVETKECLHWYEEDYYPSEPIFVPHPEPKSEDDGVVLSAVVSEVDECKGYLLVLDGRTFKEIARASFQTPSALPATFHGIFLDN